MNRNSQYTDNKESGMQATNRRVQDALPHMNSLGYFGCSKCEFDDYLFEFI